jgi:nucleoside-triphosphatase THEP1
MSIFIFTGPVHSGKTTALLKWAELQKNIAGVLMPDMDGSRKIVNLLTKEVFSIECTDPLQASEPLTAIGRYYFYTAAFEKANQLLVQALSQNPGWLVIDEAGKLELAGKGFHDPVVKAVALYNNENNPGNLLICVRDSLCDAVISFFNIRNCRVIDRLDELK